MFNKSFKRDEVPQEVQAVIQKTYLLLLKQSQAKRISRNDRDKISSFKEAVECEVWNFVLVAEIAEFFCGSLRLSHRFPKKVKTERLKECELVLGFLKGQFDIVAEPFCISFVVNAGNGGDV